VEHWAGGLREWVPIGGGTLSGFLITGILLEDLARSKTPGAAIRGFYIRRIFRLVPAFYAVLLVLALLGIGGIESSWPWHAAYLSNFYMASGGTESVLWTLAVEEQFYLLWPLVLILTPRKWLIPVAIGMILLAQVSKIVPLAFGTRLSFYLLPWQIDLLGIGCLFAILSFRNGRRNQFEWFTRQNQWLLGVLGVFLFSLAVLDWFVHGGGIMRYLFLNPLCALFFAWLVLMCARGWTGWLKPVFDNPVLQYIGRISYGIYLIHNWMPDIVEKFLGPLPKYQAAPIVVLLTFGICALSWRYFEQPLIRFGRRLSYAGAESQRSAA
jgi:peptidoglycan/LPS O-acetylase OafA/YrhL